MITKYLVDTENDKVFFSGIKIAKALLRKKETQQGEKGLQNEL